MYHPDVIAARWSAFLSDPAFRSFAPSGEPRLYPLDETAQRTAEILQSRDPETGEVVRMLTADEVTFINWTKLRVQFDAPFYLEAFVQIDEEGHGLRSLYPLWNSQSFVLDRLAAIEREAVENGSIDGVLLNILKVRQVGISTLGMALVSHRIFSQSFIRSICGSDTEEQARYLFRMVERIYDQLPFFLKPARAVPYAAGRELNLDTKSSIKSAWGKTTRGALQEVGGKKGNIERGRSQPLDEPVLTPTGWRRMGDLLAGDTVIGSQGVPTPIIGIYPQGVEAVYRVQFSDGAWTECSGDHLWQVTTAARRWKGQAPFVRTTQDLLDGGLYWDKPSGRMAKWFIPTVQPVEFPARLHTIPPYTLGVYLGDGSTRVGALQIAARDPEIKSRVTAELPSELYVGPKEYDHCWYIRRHGKRRFHLYLAELERLKLRGLYSHEKFIPDDYHIAPVADRVALLQGILDTDGWAQEEEGRVCFCTTSLRLAVGVKSIVESLGGVARMTDQPPKKSHVRKNGQRITGRFSSFRLSICLPAGIMPFSVPRKVRALRSENQRKYFPSRAIVAIEYVGQKATQCIRVAAADQLYVTRQFVVTHNTNSVVHISELATWDNPEQLDSSLLPGIPISIDTLVLFESTAELAGDWWHRHWTATQEGNGRFHNLFLAWPVKYQLPAPPLWSPNSETVAVAKQIEQDSPQWVGETLKLTRDHLYWYEQTRNYYASKNQLLQFYKEYPSNPEECITGDARICTDQGLIRIDCAQTAKQSESGSIAQWWDRGERPTWTLRTKYGRVLSATAEHLMARPDGSWTAVHDLHPGDAIRLAPVCFLAANYHHASWQWAPACTMDVVVTEDLGRLLGFFLGDGSWVDGGLDIACDAQDEDVIAEVARLLEQTIGRAPTFRYRGGYVGVRSPNKRWWEICWHLGLLNRRDDGSYHKKLAVPECIWRSPRSVVAAFLSGLFESDGHANRAARQVSLFSKSEDLIREIQLLLQGFEINAPYQTATKRANGQVYTGRYLRLNAANTDLFHASIGFVGQRKRSQAQRQKGPAGRKPDPIQVVDHVVSIEPAGMQRVYDLGVNVLHRFGANGLLVHNCFQYAGQSVFTIEECAQIDQAARPVLDIWTVQPSRDIAELKRLPPEDPQQQEQQRADRKRYPPPVAPIVAKRQGEQMLVPPGYGFRRLTKTEIQALPSLRHTVFTIYEYPRLRGRRRYVLGVDVGDGLGQDYSIVSVIREPTIEEPAEEVAQYVSNTIRPSELAFVVDAIGHYYSDEDGLEACAAIELNNHGVTVQDLLQLHLGYTHFYVWEVVDAADASSRFMKRIGWTTTSRTRPILLEKFHDAVTTIDPITHMADFRLNSAVTRSELRHFVTLGLLGEAEHAKGQHDDAIFGSAIGYYVAYRLSGGESEPLAERRRRRAAIQAAAQQTGQARYDWRNSSVSANAAQEGTDDDADDESLNSDDAGLFFDPRSSDR